MKEVLEGILEAIEDEKEAQQKYKKLKEQSDNKKAMALFDQLIKDEVEHERLLRSRYEALKSRFEDEELN